MAQPARKKDIMVGDIRITYLPDGHRKIDKIAMFPETTAEGWQLHPEWLDENGWVVRDGQVIAPGVNVIATPGHTPGHLSLVVSAGPERAIILGDVMHCPVQFDEADWSVVFDVDKELARRTRERLMRELEDPSTMSADGHFAEAVFGRVMPAQGKRLWRGIA